MKDNKSVKILVADDDPGILEVIKIILEEKEYQVTAVSEGTLVQEKIEEVMPHAILVDIWMSGMDGHEITKWLKSQEHTRHIPVILISALNEGEKIAKESGADDFLAKPFNIDDLINKVVRHTQKV